MDCLIAYKGLPFTQNVPITFLADEYMSHDAFHYLNDFPRSMLYSMTIIPI